MSSHIQAAQIYGICIADRLLLSAQKLVSNLLVQTYYQ